MSDNLFDVLKKIDRGTAVYEDIEKEFSPFMTMKWMASTKDPTRIHLINQLVNLPIFILGKDKKLLFNLLLTVADGNDKRYNWIKRPKKIPVEVLEVVCDYYEISYKEATDSLAIMEKKDVIDMAIDMGYTEKELKGLKKKLNATKLL